MRKRLLFLACFALCTGAMATGQTVPLKMGAGVKQVTVNEYTTNYEFHDGLLAVRNDETGRWGFVDESGNLAIGFRWHYDTFGQPRFGKGAALVCLRDPGNAYKVYWHIIDRQGKARKLNATLVAHTPFNDSGYAIVVKRTNDTYSQCVYIDATGREVFPALTQTVFTMDPECPEECRPFRDDRAAFFDIRKRRWGFIDRTGEIVCPAIFLEAQDFSEGLAAVKLEANGGRWGFIDPQGNLAIPAKFSQQPYPFCEGRASVEKRDGTVVMIDKTGAVVSPGYDDIRNFYLGYAFAKPKGKKWPDVVDENFQVVKTQVEGLEMLNYQRDGKPIEFINGYCNWHRDFGGRSFLTNAIGRKLDFRCQFGETIDVDHRTEKLIHVKLKDTDGFIDYDGNFVFIFAEEEF